jgi:hypothetical protein
MSIVLLGLELSRVSLPIVGLARSESRVELEFKRACLN